MLTNVISLQMQVGSSSDHSPDTRQVLKAAPSRMNPVWQAYSATEPTTAAVVILTNPFLGAGRSGHLEAAHDDHNLLQRLLQMYASLHPIYM